VFLTTETTEFLTHQALRLAHDAGDRIMDVYSRSGADGCNVCYKADNTPVTDADLAAHRLITDGLKKLTPNLPVLSEESDEIPYAERNQWPLYWLVDPLDGTAEFLRRNGEFTVNIALVQNGTPVIGIITAPVLDVAYFAARSRGAWKQYGRYEPSEIHVRSVRKTNPVVACSRCPTVGKRFQAFLDKLGTHDEIKMGAALKSCLVAEGIADVYARLGPTSEWDTAAAQCIVEEAGGHFTDTNLCKLRYNTRESLLNPHFLVFGDASFNWSDYVPEDRPAAG